MCYCATSLSAEAEDEEYLVAELSQVWGLLCEYRS